MTERRYLFEYRFDGDVYGLEITAATVQDARRKLSAMGFAMYKGEIHAKIYVGPLGFLRRLFGKSIFLYLCTPFCQAGN